MTFQSQALQPGREIVRVLELVVPRCVLSYGNGPCTAGGRAAPHPNLIQQSEVFSGGTPAWTHDQTPVFSSFVAPNSTLTGVLMVDSHNANAARSTFFVNSNDPVFAASAASAWLHASLHVLKKPASEPSFGIQLLGNDGVGQSDYRFMLDSYTGVWCGGEVGAYGSPMLWPRVVDCGSWWRVGFSLNRFGCNSFALRLFPARNGPGSVSLVQSNAVTGSAGVWGVQLAVSSSFMPPYAARGVESQWLSTGLAGACYQTTQTCQALSAYLQGDRSIFFVDARVDLPIGLNAYPAMISVSLAPSRLNPQMGVGESANLTVELSDFPHDDRGMDPYVDARSYNPSSQGTFFGRFFARDPYLQGKRVKYHEGYYAGSGTFTFSHYLTREFIVDDLDRPDYKGRVKMRATDVLRLTNGDRSLCPLPSTATLQGNITAVDTVIRLPSSAAAFYLAGDPHIRIDEEIIRLVTQTGCSWTTVRAAGKTEAAVHSGGALVQVCKTYSYMNVCSIAMDLLVNFASVPSSYIPVNSWDAEKSATLSTYDLYNILSVPTAVRDHLHEITRTCDLSLWYDEVAAKIALKHQSPWTTSFLAISDSAHFVADTMSIKGRDDVKVSRYGVRYAPTNYADGGDFGRFQLAVNSAREDARFDGRKSEHVVETTWLSDSHDSLAATIVGRAMLRYSELVPLEARFRLDASAVASVRTGQVVELNTRLLQDVDGTIKPTRMQVIESGPEFAGHGYRFSAILYQGLTAATSLAIDASTYNYNVHSAMGGPTSAVRVYLTIGSGVVVGGSGTNYAAITTSGLPAGSIVYVTPIGSSMILGYRGQRGEGADAFATYDEIAGVYEVTVNTVASPGQRGGTALYVAAGVTVFVDVSGGYLFAGGPGGGGGGFSWDGALAITNGGYGGVGQGYTNSGGPTAPLTSGVVAGGSGAVWGGMAMDGVDGNYGSAEGLGADAGEQGFAVELADASAVYYFSAGYDSGRVKGLIGV